MSDTGSIEDNNSLFTNLKNKIAYKVHNATYDPNANKFVKEQQEKKQEEIVKKSNNNTTVNNTDDNTGDANTTSGDPNTFNVKRLIKKIGNQTMNTMKRILLPFTALMLAMIIANEMIVYSVPIRLIFFIFTLLVSYYQPIVAIGLSIFYILKGGYSYYYNNMTNRTKKDIMPTIFALLPITTSVPLSSFSSAIMYPFTYPKTENAAKKLPEIMSQYWQDLQDSFKDLDKVKNLPIFVDDLKHIQKDLAELHTVKNNSAENVAKNVAQNVVQNSS